MKRFCSLTKVPGPSKKKAKTVPRDSKVSEMVHGKSPDGKEAFTVFYSDKDPFSNFYPAGFSIEGKAFNCSEQYFHYMKAVIFEDETAQSCILEATSPKDQKRLGRKVKGFEPLVWSNVSLGFMKDACKAKFEQNPGLKKILLDSAGTTIVEAAPRDRKWGIGLGKKNPSCFIRSKWRGENLLGKVLMSVRASLLEEEEKSTTTNDPAPAPKAHSLSAPSEESRGSRPQAH